MRLKIVVASHTYFGGPLVVGGHQLARAWARAGHRVLLLSPPITPWHTVRVSDPQIRARFHLAVDGLRQAEPGLWDYVPAGLFPWVWGAHLHGQLHRTLPSFTVGLTNVIRRAGFARPDLLVIDHPQFYNLDQAINARTLVYRACDLFAEIHGRSIVAELERRLVARAHCVIALSEPVAERLREYGAPQVTLVENGVEFEHFARTTPPPAEYKTFRPRRVVYSGAIDFRFDGELVVRLARARPDIEFILIGIGNGLAPGAIRGLANVHRIGARPYARLPGYLQHASVGLLPFNAHPANAGRSPMKLYEYAAAGLPILATRTPELERRAAPFVHFVDASEPERTLDEMLRTPARPDPASVATHDWSRIAQSVLLLADATEG